MSKLTKIFSSVLNIPEDKVVPKLSPENCAAWDSLNAIVLVSEIEQAFKLKFSYDEAMGVKNFTDVLALVKSKGGEINA